MEPVTGQQIVKLFETQIGKAYVYGVEVDDVADPIAYDCSELVQWVCRRLQVVPKMPDGSRYQYTHCEKHGTLINLEKAKTTAGALVFRRNRDSHTIEHVGVSDGRGNTIEARGKAYGVGKWAWRSNWTDAGLIPGVNYAEDEGIGVTPADG